MQIQKLSTVVRRAAAVGRAMVLALFTLLCLTAGTAAAATTYKLDILGNLPNKEPLSFPRAINADGQVAGVVNSSDGTETPVYWDTSGKITDLSLPTAIYGSSLAGINKAGDVALSDEGRTYLWNAGVLRDLTAGYAYAINDLGQLAGDFGTGLSLWTNGILSPLPAAPGSGTLRVSAMSNSTDVIGEAYFSSLLSTRAVLWRDGAMLDLGTLPGDSTSSASAINDLGQVVGYSTNSYGSLVRAFLWENGVMTDLGLPVGSSGGRAYPMGINIVGQVVGSYQTGAYPRAFVLQNGTLTDLTPVLGKENCVASDINDAGQIAGYCRSLVGLTAQAFRLTPVAPGVDLGMAVTRTPFTGMTGQSMIFTAVVTNVGELTATGVNFADTLPAGFNVTSLSASQGSCSGTATVTRSWAHPITMVVSLPASI